MWISEYQLDVANIAASGETRNGEWLAHAHMHILCCVHVRTNRQRARRIAAPLASRSGRSAAARILNLERSALQAPPHAIA